MNVSMDKIAWGVVVNKPLINLKPFMTLIFRIMNMPRRGMGNNNIDASLPSPSFFELLFNYFFASDLQCIDAGPRYTNVIPPVPEC